MEILQDFRFWSFVVGLMNFVGIILVGIFHKLSSDKITGNDLKHLADDVKDILKRQHEMETKLNQVQVDVALLKGKLE